MVRKRQVWPSSNKFFTRHTKVLLEPCKILQKIKKLPQTQNTAVTKI